MGIPDSQRNESQTLRTLIEQAERQSKELRQVVDRIVELSPNDKGTQELDQLVDVLLVKLSAASIRSAKLGTRAAGRHRE